MPAVEPGVIIEYRWREVRHDSSGYFARLSFQRDIPIQLVKYTLKTSSEIFLGFRAKPFNMASTPMVMEKDKRFSDSMTNVHGFHYEPHMPPEDQVRSWMPAFYQPSRYSMSVDFNKSVYDEYTSKMKVNDDIRRAAQATIANASTPDQKLERLFDFCGTKIKNINDDASGLTGDDLARLKENKNAADTLKRGMGTGEDIDLLFGALIDGFPLCDETNTSMRLGEPAQVSYLNLEARTFEKEKAHLSIALVGEVAEEFFNLLHVRLSLGVFRYG